MVRISVLACSDVSISGRLIWLNTNQGEKMETSSLRQQGWRRAEQRSQPHVKKARPTNLHARFASQARTCPQLPLSIPSLRDKFARYVLSQPAAPGTNQPLPGR